MSAQHADASGTTGTEAAQIDCACNAGEQSERNNALAALKAASDTCHAAPHRPEAHYAYGQASVAPDDHRDAERGFVAAIKPTPTSVAAKINDGIARYRERHVEGQRV
jgi:hypothetical protein